ncbi:HNH endonuclease [Rhodococcus cerastii]|nr:HNH endonuclease [Rhodococcus cerastii]
MNDKVKSSVTRSTSETDDKYSRVLEYFVNENNCHIFRLSARDRNGYAVVKIDGKNWYAHRYVFEQKNGPVPAGMEVMHLCKNQRDCINPNHLKAGTHADNMAQIPEDRKNFCAVGHEQNRTNSYWFADSLICKICKAEKLAVRKDE